MILVRGGSVRTQDGIEPCDVLIVDDHVLEVSAGIRPGDAEVIDAEGCLVGPGFVDVHTHLREPGQTWKEDIESGSRAAAAGGFTAVVAMPNTDPPIDEAKVAVGVVDRGREVGFVDVMAGGALTRGRAGVVAAEIEELYQSGVRIYTDDGDSVGDDRLLEELMRQVAVLPGAVLAQHAEDPDATAGGHMHDGEISKLLGIPGLPAHAEVSVVQRDLKLVRRTGVRYHCQHVSSAGTLELLSEAKTEGLAVTAEVTPHHLSFTDEDLVDLDPNFKMYPPLRTPLDREALRRALRQGLIDMVATDHAPHTSEEKKVGFTNAPRGVIGLETAAAVAWDIVGEPMRFFEVMSVAPARLVGMGGQGRSIAPGERANLVVFDPEAPWTPTTFASKSANSPHLGREMRGVVVATIHNGRLTHRSEVGR